MLIVGAGPSGLSAAYHLALLGHRVTIRDAGPVAGGMMRFGIPKYRLPRDVLEAEIQRILDLGVELELNTSVGDVLEAVARRWLRRGVPGRRRPPGQACLHPGRQRLTHPRRRFDAAQHGRRGAAPAGTPGRGLRRRQHGDRRRAHGQAPRRARRP